jgi:hypothetical protein
MPSKGYGRKWSWPNLRYYPCICLEKLRKITKTSVRTSGLRAKIWTGDLKYEAGVLTARPKCSVLAEVLRGHTYERFVINLHLQ